MLSASGVCWLLLGGPIFFNLLRYGKYAADIENTLTDRRNTRARKATWLWNSDSKVIKASWHTWHIVQKVMRNLDPDGLENYRLHFKMKKIRKSFTCNYGHYKMFGLKNWTFPLGLHGCIDTFSRKILCHIVFYANSRLEIISRKYFKYLLESLVLAKFLQIDKGI